MMSEKVTEERSMQSKREYTTQHLEMLALLHAHSFNMDNWSVNNSFKWTI